MDIAFTKTRGFTVIELTIIIVLVGILAAYAFFNYPGLVMNVAADSEQFASDIRYTQALSMSQAQRYYISKASATSYKIFNQSGTAITFANGGTTMTLNSGLTFGNWTNLTNSVVSFDSRGNPYLSTGTPGTALAFGTSYTITITGGGFTKTITITPITGMVTVT